jgi:hypothetical protein
VAFDATVGRGPWIALLGLMIVYGDSVQVVEIGLRANQLRERAVRTIDLLLDGHVAHDAVRALLVCAGQIEQALADVYEGDPDAMIRRALEQSQEVTDRAARSLYTTNRAPRAHVSAATIADLEAMIAQLEILGGLTLPGEMCVPEGLTFSALYPEQYFVAAERWIEQHPARGSQKIDLIIGVRSVGTTLSAAVGAVLSEHGHRFERVTVRPRGHPSEHELELPQGLVVADRRALIVDQGPGLSGSSMAAVARALERRGLSEASISFFPAHGGEPGRAASPETRRWWSRLPRYVASPEEVVISGRTLDEQILDALAFDGDRPELIERIGAGRWRKFAYEGESSWPAVCTRLERPKLLVLGDQGRRWVLKFFGHAWTQETDLLAEEIALAAARDVARRGFGPTPACALHGYLAAPWIDGRPLSRDDASPEVLESIASYLASSIAPVMSKTDQDAAVGRSERIIAQNAPGALSKEGGARLADITRSLLAREDELRRGAARSRDGSWAPHTFIRGEDARISKASVTGQEVGRACRGAQPIDWDVAAVLVEWGLFGEAAARFVGLATSLDARAFVPKAALAFHRLAYVSLRLGELSSALEDADEAVGERARIERERAMLVADMERTLVGAG